MSAGEAPEGIADQSAVGQTVAKLAGVFAAESVDLVAAALGVGEAG